MTVRTCPFCERAFEDVAASFCPHCGRAIDRGTRAAPPDATMIVDRQRPAASATPPSGPPKNATEPKAKQTTPVDNLPAEATVIVNVVKPQRDLPTAAPTSGGWRTTSATHAAPGGTTRAMPSPDTGIESDADVAGWTQVSYLEVSLLQRPLAQARILRTLRRNEPIGVVWYRGAYAAIRLPDGTTGYVARQALAAPPTARELSSPEDDFAARPNVVRVRAEGTSLRGEPSRLATSIRGLQMGEPVQLRSYTAYFAGVRTVDGATGYVERSALGQPSVSPGERRPVGPIVFGAAAAVAFIGAILPWTAACSGCSSKAGLDHAEGMLVLLAALAAGVLIFAQQRVPNVPPERFLLGMTAAGGFVALLALVARSGDSASFGAGVYVTLIAGVAMAVAPWIDRLQASRARNAAGNAGGPDA